MVFVVNEKGINNGNVGHLVPMENKSQKSKLKCLIGLQIGTIVAIVLMVGMFCIVAYPLFKERKAHNHDKPSDNKQNEKIVTLYALDPLANSFGFGDGTYGQIFKDWSVYNKRSDINFNTYKNGSFAVGIEGAVVGIIINLGSSEDLQKKYKYQETVGNGQGYASIHRQEKTLLILKNNSYDHIFQPMVESVELFQEGKVGATASINLGHLYVLRITDHTKPSFELIVKMLVIAYQPNEWITIRWDVL